METIDLEIYIPTTTTAEPACAADMHKKTALGAAAYT